MGVYQPSVGTWFLNKLGRRHRHAVALRVSDVVVPGDYNGDGPTEVGVYRPTTPRYAGGGTWYVRNLANGTNTIVTFGGVEADVPLPLPYAIRRFFV